MNNAVLDRSWLEEFGGLLGLRLHDLTESYGIKVNDLLVYTYPDKKEVEKANLQGYEFTSKQLETWKIKYHKLIMGKISYDIYVDDKSLFFKKNWAKKKNFY